MAHASEHTRYSPLWCGGWQCQAIPVINNTEPRVELQDNACYTKEEMEALPIERIKGKRKITIYKMKRVPNIISFLMVKCVLNSVHNFL